MLIQKESFLFCFCNRYDKLRPFLSNMVANEHSTSEYCIISETCLQSMLLTPTKERTSDNMRAVCHTGMNERHSAQAFCHLIDIVMRMTHILQLFCIFFMCLSYCHKLCRWCPDVRSRYSFLGIWFANILQN